MSRQVAFGIQAAAEITAAEQVWVGEAAERIARSDAHLAANMTDGACMCGGNGHRDVVYSPTLTRSAVEQLGCSEERASQLVRAAEDAAGCGPEGKWGF